MEDKYIKFLAVHIPKIVIIMMIFQIIVFLECFWNHEIYEFGFIGLIFSIESWMWYWINKNE